MNITNDIITAYLNNLYSSINPQLKELRSFAEDKRVPIILKSTEGLLLNLLKIKKPARVLEVGAAIGYSACCFADVCGCRVVTIESDADSYEAATANVKNLGYEDYVRVLHGEAEAILEEMPASLGKDDLFDAVFIDAAKSHYKSFWDLAVPLCKQDALIICDNVLMKGMTASDEYDPKKRYKTSIRKMREFIKYITGLEYANTCILPVGDGISLSVIDKEKINVI